MVEGLPDPPFVREGGAVEVVDLEVAGVTGGDGVDGRLELFEPLRLVPSGHPGNVAKKHACAQALVPALIGDKPAG